MYLILKETGTPVKPIAGNCDTILEARDMCRILREHYHAEYVWRYLPYVPERVTGKKLDILC